MHILRLLLSPVHMHILFCGFSVIRLLYPGMCPVGTYRIFSEYFLRLIDSQGTIHTVTLPFLNILYDTVNHQNINQILCSNIKEENLVQCVQYEIFKHNYVNLL